MGLIEENSTLPDLEKLERYEFNLDEEERQRLIALGEQGVKQVSVTCEVGEIAKLNDTPGRFCRREHLNFPIMW